MSIGSRIKYLRQQNKMTQEEFSSKLKIHSKQLAHYESGRNVPSVDVIAKIANLCETSTDYIIQGEDKAYIKKTKINDLDLLELFRRSNKLRKTERDKIKWALKSLLNGEKE